MTSNGMKQLNGKELSVYIKERQAKQVRGLIQANGIKPKLAIVQTNDNPVINTYVRMKKQYGADIQADVDVHIVAQNKVAELLKKLNDDDDVHGIIVQLPLADPAQTDELVNLVAPQKDVDALGEKAKFEPATPLAILWLLAGYNIDLKNKHVLLIGRGKLVGRPLERMLKDSGVDVEMIGRVDDLSVYTKKAEIIITATGSHGVLMSDMINPGIVVVDAGTASESGKTVGDLHDDVYERDDITVTPKRGGVGPLTVSALFDNVIQAAKRTVKVEQT